MSAALAVTLAITALFGAMPSNPAIAQEGEPSPVAITTGQMDWGIRLSFRGYVGEAGITVSEGLTRTPGGSFIWPVSSGTFDPATNTTDISFGGKVHFAAHAGALDLTVSNPRLVIDSDGSRIHADMSGLALNGSPFTLLDAEIATVEAENVDPTITETTTTWSGLTARLSPAGVEPFGGFYSPGARMDDAHVTYQGPGGKPIPSVEQWSDPGVPVHSVSRVGEATYSSSMAIDADLGLAFMATAQMVGGVLGGALVAIDLETGQEVARQAAPGPVGGNTPFWVPRFFNDAGYVPATKTLMVLFESGATRELRTYTYQPETKTFALGTVPGSFVARETSRIIGHPTEPIAYHHVAGNLDVLTLDANGAWQARRVATPGVDTLAAVASDGTLVASATAGGLVTFTVPAGDTATPTPVPGTAALMPFSSNTARVEGAAGPNGAVSVTALNADRVVTVAPGETGWAVIGHASVNDPSEVAVDPIDGTIYVAEGNVDRVAVVRGSTVVTRHIRNWHYYLSMGLDADRALHVWTADGQFRYARVGVTPEFGAGPADAVVDLGTGTTGTAEFAVDATGDPAPALTWQTRPAGATHWSAWQDIPDATGTQLALPVSSIDEGRQVRAVARSHAPVPGDPAAEPMLVGEVASAPATITVLTAPAVVQQIEDVTVTAGDDATFKVMPSGNPYPTITWQRYQSGFWVNITEDTDGFEIDGGFLTVTDTNVDQTGTRIRARLRSTGGTAYTRTATLTVQARDLTPRYVIGGDLDWGVRASFRNYIVSPIAHGQIGLEDPATRAEDGTFVFPAVSGTVVDRQVNASFDGAVHFTGHVGMGTPPGVPALDVRIAEIRIEVAPDGQTGRLIADVASRGLSSGEVVVFDDVHFADLDLTSIAPVPVEGGLRFEGVPATLTAAGVPAFADFYPEGAPLDPLGFTLLLSDEEPTPLSPTEAFVTAALVDFLGAEPTEAELAAGVTQVEQRGKAVFLRTLSTSDAWLAAVVDELYLDTLGRPASAADRAYWAGQIRAGWSVARVAASMYAAAEHHAAAGGTNAAWVADLYEKILGRTAGAAEVDYWVAETVAKGRGNVALRFYQTPESARARVAGLYGDLLGRTPASGDVAYWGPVVVARGDLTLAVSLAASPEYQTRAEARFA